MSVLVESEQELNECLKDNPRLAVLFYASWCPHSQRFLPLFEKQAAGKDCYRRVIVDDLDALVDKYGIEVYPTIIYFEQGRIVKRLDGVHGAGIDEGKLTRFVAECRLP